MLKSAKNNSECAFLMSDHLSILDNIRKYLTSLHTGKYDWIRNSFSNKLSFRPQFNVSQEERKELKYPPISNKIIKILLCSISYLWEVGFSTLANIKSRKRVRLTNVVEEMILVWSWILILKNYFKNIKHKFHIIWVILLENVFL